VKKAGNNLRRRSNRAKAGRLSSGDKSRGSQPVRTGTGKRKLPAKTSVRMQVYDVMPLVANLAGIPYPPGCIGSVPWEIFPFDMELKAYRNFFLLRQKLVLADGFSTYLFGTSNLSDIDSYKPGISYLPCQAIHSVEGPGIASLAPDPVVGLRRAPSMLI